MASNEDMIKEKAHLEDILKNVEGSYRNAKISEKNYNELREKTMKRLGEIETEINSSSARKETINGGKNKKEISADNMPKEKANKEEDLAGNFTDEAAAQFGPQEEVKDVEEEEKPKTEANVEIEKMKVLIDAIREEKKALQETIQSMSESIGEIRSMAFQSEGLAKELEMKIEKTEEEISEIKPSEISKRLRKIDENIEKYQLYVEKSDAKFEDLSKKINNVHDMLKSAGGIENLSEINKQIGRKLEDINEAMKYIERLAVKTEKAFLEMNKNLEDFHIYKSRQDNLEDAAKDIIKSLDEANVRIESLTTRKDFESYIEDVMIIKKQMDEMSRLIPLIKVKLPEPIEKLSKDRDEINALLEMLEGQEQSGSISMGEYNKLKKANEKKLKSIEDSLEQEWKKVEKLLESGGDLESISQASSHVPETSTAEAQAADAAVSESTASQEAVGNPNPEPEASNSDEQDKNTPDNNPVEASNDSQQPQQSEEKTPVPAANNPEENVPESKDENKSGKSEPVQKNENTGQQPAQQTLQAVQQPAQKPVKVKRKRGRPRKYPRPEEVQPSPDIPPSAQEPVSQTQSAAEQAPAQEKTEPKEIPGSEQPAAQQPIAAQTQTDHKAQDAAAELEKIKEKAEIENRMEQMKKDNEQMKAEYENRMREMQEMMQKQMEMMVSKVSEKIEASAKLAEEKKQKLNQKSKVLDESEKETPEEKKKVREVPDEDIPKKAAVKAKISDDIEDELEKALAEKKSGHAEKEALGKKDIRKMEDEDDISRLKSISSKGDASKKDVLSILESMEKESKSSERTYAIERLKKMMDAPEKMRNDPEKNGKKKKGKVFEVASGIKEMMK